MTDENKNERDSAQSKAGRRASLVSAGTGVFWIVTMYLGGQFDWPVRIRVLFDIMALAGFGIALLLTYQARRHGRSGK